MCAAARGARSIFGLLVAVCSIATRPQQCCITRGRVQHAEAALWRLDYYSVAVAWHEYLQCSAVLQLRTHDGCAR